MADAAVVAAKGGPGMEVVMVVAIALVAVWISGSNWERRSPYFTVFHDGPPVQPLHGMPSEERGRRG